jgi:hypothetical protein
MKERLIGQKVTQIVSNGYEFGITLEHGLSIELDYDQVEEKFKAIVTETIVRKVAEL